MAPPKSAHGCLARVAFPIPVRSFPPHHVPRHPVAMRHLVYGDSRHRFAFNDTVGGVLPPPRSPSPPSLMLFVACQRGPPSTSQRSPRSSTSSGLSCGSPAVGSSLLVTGEDCTALAGRAVWRPHVPLSPPHLAGGPRDSGSHTFDLSRFAPLPYRGSSLPQALGRGRGLLSRLGWRCIPR